jgi:hypothetical protein
MKRILLLAVGTCILWGCSRDAIILDPPVPPIVNEDCFDDPYSCEIRPLTVGNSWTYYEFNYDIYGRLLGTDTLYNTIVRDTLVDSEVFYIDSTVVWHMASLNLWTNRASGLWYNSENSDSAVLKYRYPTYIADWYTCPDCWWMTRVISKDTVISIRQESYRCYCYMLDYQNGAKSYYFMAPGIGQVMHEEYHIEYGQLFGPLSLLVRSMLVDYHIEE